MLNVGAAEWVVIKQMNLSYRYDLQLIWFNTMHRPYGPVIGRHLGNC